MARRVSKRVEDSDDDAPALSRREPPSVQTPAERPAPPVDVFQLDALLKDALVSPVTLDDIEQVRTAVMQLWQGAAVEVYTTDWKSVLVVAWWGSYEHGAIVRRAYRAR